jgi:hypothetical protein
MESPEPRIHGFGTSLTVWWQFQKDFLMGETRWVNMDAWTNGQAETGWREHLRGYQEREFSWSKHNATYHGNPAGPIKFEFIYENTYFVTNSKSGERCKMRRIAYTVMAP